MHVVATAFNRFVHCFSSCNLSQNARSSHEPCKESRACVAYVSKIAPSLSPSAVSHLSHRSSTICHHNIDPLSIYLPDPIIFLPMQRAQQTGRVTFRSVRPPMATAFRVYSSVESSADATIISVSPNIISKSTNVHHGWPGLFYPFRKGLKKIAPSPSKEERKLQSLRSKEANKREAELDAFRRRNLQIFIEKFVSDSAKLPYPKFDKILCPPYVPPGGRDGKRDL